MDNLCENLKQTLFMICKANFAAKLYDRLSPSEAAFLDYLYYDTQGKSDRSSQSNIKDMAGTMGITAPALTQTVNKLEAKRVVRRVLLSGSSRSTYVKFTEDGLNMYLSETESMQKRLMRITEKIGEADCERLINITTKLNDCFSE